MTRGRRPDVQSLRSQRALERAAKVKAEPSPVVAADGPTMPEWLVKGAAERWPDVIERLRMAGTLADSSVDVIARYCQALAELQDLQTKVAEHGLLLTSPSGVVKPHPYVRMRDERVRDVKDMEDRLGLTFASRARLDIAKANATKGARSGTTQAPAETQKEAPRGPDRFFT